MAYSKLEKQAFPDLNEIVEMVKKAAAAWEVPRADRPF